MKDIPCIMSAPMVQALLAGRKRMTRRLAWRLSDVGDNHTRTPTSWQAVWPVDRIWIRESHWRWGYWKGTKKSGNPSYEFVPAVTDGFEPMVYAEEPPGPVRKFAEVAPGYCRRPAIFHPRAASRITLKVKATRIERLWDITPADCLAEGVEYEGADPGFYYVPGIMPHSITAVGVEERADLMPHEVQCFRKLWMHIHDRQSWDANPEVVAVSFDVHLQNIDTLKEAA